MCGIAGCLAPADVHLDLGAIRRMADVIEHRGPDGSGEATIAGEGVHGWIGHRRLKIIDLSDAAAQPMASDDGRLVLTYNGEIYNFRELRRELEAGGARFRSTGDTEVVLRAFERWGPDAVRRLDGMFALAVWDARTQTLLLARDRTGKKPLFFAAKGGRVAFGSEIKAVLACPWVARRPATDQLAEYLVFGYVPNPATLYEGVEHVPPGTMVVFNGSMAPRVVPYWDALPRSGSRPPGSGLKQEIRQLLTDAVQRRLISDVPLGALLSGGIDSSLVVALMAQISREPVHTFSIGFADDVTFDETAHAQGIAERFNTRHREFKVQLDAVGLTDRLIWHHDQPFHDSSAIPTFLVSQLASEQVTVVLNGDGGDEVFGGYDRFRAAALAVRAPRALAHAARRAVHRLPADHGYYSRRRRAERFLELADAPLERRYQSWISVIAPERLSEMMRGDGPLGRDVTASMTRCYERARDAPALDRILYANFKTYLPDDLAVKMDRMSMAHSLETRSPFLDTALIECLAGVRARRKVGLVRLKPLLRAACFDLLPREIWDRPKHGFGVPMGTWMRGELGTVFEDEVLAHDARTADWIDPAAARQLYGEHRQGERENGFRLWTLLTLERWLRTLEQPLALRPPAHGEPADAAEVKAR